MILFNVSQTLSKVLASHLKPAKHVEPHLVWDLELITVGAEQCIIACEQQSQYLMLFCGLKGEQMRHFPEIFEDRLWREVMALCPQLSKQEKTAFARYLVAASEEQFYQLNPNPLEEGRFHKLIENLEYRVIAEKMPLPSDGKSALQYTLPINGKVRKKTEDSPLALYRELCWLMAEDCKEQARLAKEAASPVTGREENIVMVDFNKKR
ncbi:hypothetical protein P886_0159 [Alteromonadaceae bacterium 2753L.S.0a.02]|nr:hypothetical protein P886_0159 [Alteromonadaceae bacterium 2753L.S.0a.02]